MPPSVPQCLDLFWLPPKPNLAAMAFVAGTMAALLPAAAHDALPTAAKPDGWAYPSACCSDYDCRLVEPSRISERPQGYVLNDTGEVIGYGDPKLRNSPDGEYHWCTVNGSDKGRTICLFAPPKGF